MDKLEGRFDTAMMTIYQRAKDEAGYNATIFLQMLYEHRGLQTAKQLINSAHTPAGYTALYERKRLDLTVEAFVIENAEWQPLFTSEEVDRARTRLLKYGYKSGG